MKGSHWIKKGQPAVVLAPMEGVTDAPMRALMSERGGFTHCVSEFLRISSNIPPPRVFFKHVPELALGSRTGTGLPLSLQLLGGDAGLLAESAAVAVKLGAGGIDLNFGCPAPTVNRHDGGATLLKYPLRIREIVRAVRAAVPAELPVSAKLRLGWDRLDPVHENSAMAAEGGASWITIHARTRVQGYAPPAYWGPIGEVARRLSIPVVANGDIWTVEDFRRCQSETGCEHYMLGRGAMVDPWLPSAVAAELGLHPPPTAPFGDGALDWLPLLEHYARLNALAHGTPEGTVRRIKQWVKMVHLRRPLSWFDTLKRATSLPELFEGLRPPG